MTDSKLLEKYIERAGFKLKYVAEYVGLSPYGLRLKIDNKNEFKSGEISRLCELLNISSLHEKEKIFFAIKDD